jgi:hypothetical protein
MGTPIRLGVAVGSALTPLVVYLVFGYLAPLPGYVVMLAPMAIWIGFETFIRSRRRLRRLWLLLGLAGAGVWWWWVHAWLTTQSQHQASLLKLYGYPTAWALALVGVAVIAGMNLARHDRREHEPEPVSTHH